jgi:hypothetical protein
MKERKKEGKIAKEERKGSQERSTQTRKEGERRKNK